MTRDASFSKTRSYALPKCLDGRAEAVAQLGLQSLLVDGGRTIGQTGYSRTDPLGWNSGKMLNHLFERFKKNLVYNGKTAASKLML